MGEPARGMPPASGVLSCGSTGYSSKRSSRTVPARLPADAHPVETGVGAELSRNKGPRCSDKLPAAQLDHEVAEGLRRKQGRLRGRDKGVGPDSPAVLLYVVLPGFRECQALGPRLPVQNPLQEHLLARPPARQRPRQGRGDPARSSTPSAPVGWSARSTSPSAPAPSPRTSPPVEAPARCASAAWAATASPPTSPTSPNSVLTASSAIERR